MTRNAAELLAAGSRFLLGTAQGAPQGLSHCLGKHQRSESKKEYFALSLDSGCLRQGLSLFQVFLAIVAGLPREISVGTTRGGAKSHRQSQG